MAAAAACAVHGSATRPAHHHHLNLLDRGVHAAVRSAAPAPSASPRPLRACPPAWRRQPASAAAVASGSVEVASSSSGGDGGRRRWWRSDGAGRGRLGRRRDLCPCSASSGGGGGSADDDGPSSPPPSSSSSPESLFSRELRRRGIGGGSSSSSSKTGNEEAQPSTRSSSSSSSGSGAGGNRAGGAGDWSAGQRERSQALNSEGLEGLPARAWALIRLGATFYVSLWPLALLVAVAFAAVYLGLGDSFIHPGRKPTGSGSPAMPSYIDPYELLRQEEELMPRIPFNSNGGGGAVNTNPYYAPSPYDDLLDEDEDVGVGGGGSGGQAALPAASIGEVVGAPGSLSLEEEEALLDSF